MMLADNKNKKVLFLLNLLIILLLISSFSNSVVCAEEIRDNTEEYSQVYKYWSSLSDDEKQKVPEPDKYLEEFVPTTSFSTNLRTFSPIARTTVLPERYDLRNVNGKSYVTPVKDQDDLNLCWAYAATTVLESNVLMRGLGEYKFNPIHITHAVAEKFSDYKNRYGFDELNTGGAFNSALYYWTNGTGPVSFFSGTGTLLLPAAKTLVDTADIKVKESYVLPNLRIDSSYANLDDYIKLIKQEIITNGAISFSSASPQSASGDTLSSGYKCGNPYNKAYYSVYTDNINDFNCSPHEMVIIGWDDNFSKEHFNSGLKTGKKPSRDGAWIVQNSWGVNSGKNGYYYYSYEDYNLNAHEKNVVVDSEKKDYDNIYQYASSGYQSYYLNSGEIFANVFDKEKETEMLTEISFEIFSVKDPDKTKYELYVNAADGNLGKENLKLIQVGETGSFKYPGYYTIELAKPIELVGDKFAIAIKLYGAEMKIDFYKKDLLLGRAKDILPGQSYVLSDSWIATDLYNFDEISYAPQIKAFTTKKVQKEIPSAATTLKHTAITFPLTTKTISLKTITSNIPAATVLNYKIKNSSQKDVTSSFDLKKDIIISNLGVSTIQINDTTPEDIYTIETYYNDILLDVDTLYLKSKPLEVSNVTSKPDIVYEGEPGNFYVTSSNGTGKINYEIKDSKNNNRESFFEVTSSEMPDSQIKFSIGTYNNTPAGEYTISISDSLVTKSKTFTIYKHSQLSLKETSPYKITVEGNTKYIGNIVLKRESTGIKSLTKKEFISHFENFGGEIYEKDGKTKVSSDEFEMKTGMILRDSSGYYNIIIKGDINGDGQINVVDVSKLYSHIRNTNTMTENYFLRASDTSDDSMVNIVDVSKLYSFIRKTIENL